jgi:hypothetical protein
MARTEKSSTLTWSQTVRRKPLVEALTLAKKCVAKEDARVDDYKCFKFYDGFVSAYDGVHGISVACDLKFEILVFAERFYNYLKALDTDDVQLERKELELVVNDEATFACPEADDFPEILPSDGDPLLANCAGFATALTDVEFCVTKQAVKLGVPYGVLLRENYLYASDTRRAARAALDVVTQQFKRPVFLPGDAIKMVTKLGDPDLILAGDSQIAFIYNEKRLYYVVRLLGGPASMSQAIDHWVDAIERPKVFSSPPPVAAVDNLERIKKSAKGSKGSGKNVKDIKLKVSFEHEKLLGPVLTLSAEDKGTQTKVKESLTWPEGPREPFEFFVDLEFLLAALKEDFETLDLSGLPKVLLFTKAGIHHFIALDY